jgi:hypothetical protein
MLRRKVVRSNSGGLVHALRALVGVRDQPDLLRPTMQSPAALQSSTRDATRPAPISRARVHPPAIDVGIQTSGPAPTPAQGLARQDPVHCADAHGCTSRRSNTHRIETREVLYRWHPWYGRSVSIYQVVDRSGHGVMRCGDDQGARLRRLEAPQWMFDAATCPTLQMASMPIVECEALIDLKYLLAGSLSGSRWEIAAPRGPRHESNCPSASRRSRHDRESGTCGRCSRQAPRAAAAASNARSGER